MARSSKQGVFGVSINRLASVGAGAVGAKLMNAPLKKYLAKYLPPDDPTTDKVEGKVGRLVISGGKVLLGAYLAGSKKVKNPMLKDVGLGIIAVGSIELVETLAPKLNLNSVGYLEDAERVGEVVEIDLAQLNGSSFDRQLENYQEIAGGSGYASNYLVDEMELAGMEVY